MILEKFGSIQKVVKVRITLNSLRSQNVSVLQTTRGVENDTDEGAH
jgi:hypothetical protein